MPQEDADVDRLVTPLSLTGGVGGGHQRAGRHHRRHRFPRYRRQVQGDQDSGDRDETGRRASRDQPASASQRGAPGHGLPGQFPGRGYGFHLECPLEEHTQFLVHNSLLVSDGVLS